MPNKLKTNDGGWDPQSNDPWGTSNDPWDPKAKSKSKSRSGRKR
jgi:hypothetical protein